MRMLKTILSAMFITVAAQSWAMETNEFSISQAAVSHSSPVSFSIANPKDWAVTQDSRLHFDEDMVLDGNWICTFWSTNFSTTNCAGFTIFRSGGDTAKEAADEFSKHSGGIGIYTLKGLNLVKTIAGDSGYLLEFEGNFDNVKFPPLQEIPGLQVAFGDIHQIKLGQVVLQEFFFHGGKKGSIRVEILTREVDSSFRSELDKMVLGTLRFDGEY